MAASLGIGLFACVPYVVVKNFLVPPLYWHVVPYAIFVMWLASWIYQFWFGRQEEHGYISGETFHLKRCSRLRTIRRSTPLTQLHRVNLADGGDQGQLLTVCFRHFPALLVYEKALSEPEKFNQLAETMLAYPIAARTALPVPWMTLILVGVMCLLFMLNTTTRDTILFDLVASGAFVPEFVLDGEVFRMLSYAFLHGYTMHLLINCGALLLLGFALEHYLGRFGLLALFLVGAAASILSLYATDVPMAMGASGGVFTLVGAYIFLKLRRPSGFTDRFPVSSVIGIIAGSLSDLFLSGIMGYQVAVVHAAGVFIGLLLMRIMIAQPAVIVASGAVLVVGAALTHYQSQPWSEQRALQLARVWLERQTSVPRLAQTVGWYIAISPLAARADVQHAYMILRDDEDIASRDTAATLLARLGRYGEAIDIENTILRQARIDREIYASQLVRFQISRNIQQGGTSDIVSESAHRAFTDAICQSDQGLLFFRSPPGVSPAADLCTSEFEILGHHEGAHRVIAAMPLDTNLLSFPLALYNEETIR